MSTPDPDAAARMHAIAAALSAAGLTAQVHVTRGVVDVTATWERPEAKAAEVIVDLSRRRRLYGDPVLEPAVGDPATVGHDQPHKGPGIS
jgi:hypothetical protein